MLLWRGVNYLSSLPHEALAFPACATVNLLQEDQDERGLGPAQSHGLDILKTPLVISFVDCRVRRFLCFVGVFARSRGVAGVSHLVDLFRAHVEESIPYSR